jgi:hypothetical protein
MCSSSVQQVQLPFAGCNYCLDHKNSSSTTTGGRVRWTGSSLLLRVCVHPQLHYSHQQTLQYTPFHPRAHRIDREATLRDQGSCKLFFLCCSSLSTAFFSQLRVFCLLETLELMITVISPQANQKIGHNLCKMHASSWLLCG